MGNTPIVGEIFILILKNWKIYFDFQGPNL